MQSLAAAVGAAVMTVALLAVLNYPDARSGAAQRDANRTFVVGSEDDMSGLQVVRRFVPIDGRGMSVVSLYGSGSRQLLPPGLERFPDPGESVVSPAVMDLCANPQRCPVAGRIRGAIGADGLVNPKELFVYIAPEGALPATAEPVAGVGTEAFVPKINPTASLGFVAFAIAPAAALLTVAVRLGARRNARRITALRTLGVSRVRVAVDLVAPLITGSLAGAVVGALVYPGLLRAARDVPLVGSSYDQRDLFASPSMSVAVVAVVAAVLSAATLLGSARYLSRRVAGPISRRSFTATSTVLTLALAVGLILVVVRAVALAGDYRSSPGGPWSTMAVLLLAVGLMGGAAPLTAAFARLVPVSAGRAALGLGARRAQTAAASATRASGPIALATFFACIYLSLDGLYSTEVAPSFRDEPTTTTAFATLDGATTTVRPELIADETVLAVEEWPLNPMGRPGGRAIVATCDDAARLFASHVTGCNGQVQILDLNTTEPDAGNPSAATDVTLPTPSGGIALPVSRTAASVTTTVNLPFAAPTMLVPPDLVDGHRPTYVERVLGRVTTTREAFRQLTVRAARIDPATTVELPAVGRPGIASVYGWLALGATVGGLFCLIAMGAAFADLRTQQMRGYALLGVLGASSSTSRTAHVVALTLPAAMNALIATTAGAFAGFAYVRTVDLLPSPLAFTGIAAISIAVSLTVAVLTAPTRLSPQAISSLIRAV